jgi:hypothetical protein
MSNVTVADATNMLFEPVASTQQVTLGYSVACLPRDLIDDLYGEGPDASPTLPYAIEEWFGKGGNMEDAKELFSEYERWRLEELDIYASHVKKTN